MLVKFCFYLFEVIILRNEIISEDIRILYLDFCFEADTKTILYLIVYFLA